MNFNFENFEKDLELLESIKNVSVENSEQVIKDFDLILEKYKRHIEIDKSARKIIETFLLVDLLKSKHIKITQKQHQDYLLYRKQIEDAIDKLKKINSIVVQIENKEIYINSEIIDLLCIERTYENLIQIIAYNKKVNRKKNFKVDDDVEEEIQEEKKEIVVEEKMITSKKKKKKKVSKKSEEIIFTTSDEIFNYLKNKYDIVLSDLCGKSLEEMAQIINILEQKQFNNIKKDFLKKVLVYSSVVDFERIFKILKESSMTLDDLYNIVVFDYDFENTISNIYDVCFIPFFESKEEQLRVLNLDKKIIARILRNTLVLLIYKMSNISDNKMLSRKINVEYIDRIIECGYSRILKKDACKLFDFFDVPNVDNSVSKKMNDLIFKRYYGLITNLEQNYNNVSNAEFDRRMKTMVEDEMKKRGLPIQNNLTNMLSLIFSKNEILKNEQQTSASSMQHIEFCLTNDEVFDNIFVKYLETKYLKNSSDYLPMYVIPVDEDKVGINNIFVSRTKVIRLIGEHIFNGDEITAETVIDCIFYNMIITDDLLNSAKEIMLSELKKLEPYQRIKTKK